MQRRELLKQSAALGLGASALGLASRALADGPKPGALPPVARAGENLPDLKFSAAEYERRYKGVRAAMAEAQIDALVVVGTHEWSGGDLANISYLGAPMHVAELSFLVVPIDGMPVSPYALFGFPTMPPLPPGMRPPWIKSPSSVEFDFQEVPVRERSLNSPDYARGVVNILKKLKLDQGRVGFVSMKNMPADVYSAVREWNAKLDLVDAQEILMKMRLYKSAEEIEFMKRSGYIADRGISAMMESAGVGVSDYDVFFAVDKACAEAGAPVGGFHLYGSGPWGGPPGSTSNIVLEPGSARIIQKGDMLVPEVTSNYKGYFTQLTVPASIGSPPDSFLKVYEMCEKVHKATRENFLPGRTVREMDAFTAAFTEDVSDGEYTTLFGVQAGEHEYSLWHYDYELKPGAMAYNQPFFMPKKKMGGPFHVFGDAMVMTEAEPILLHKSEMDLIVL